MPGKKQRSVTLPDWVYEIAEKYFEKHKEELKMKDITSVTALIRAWILEEAQQPPS